MPHSFGIRARTRHMFKKNIKGASGGAGANEELSLT
jgi:hypothetical protein